MSLPFALRRSASILSAFVLLLAALVGTPLAVAQKDAGAIVGTVHDPTGAVVVGAKVSVTDFERGQTFTATTSASGEYVASPLRIGKYTVTVEHPGFKTAVSNTVEINVQDRAAVNITLEIGATSEKMEVTATTPLLNTETSELGQVVDQKRVSTLPLNGRNFAQLALLSAGTAPSEPGSRDEGGYGFSANGARSLQNNFLLDGVDNNSNLPDLLNETNFVIQPPIDALEEFKVQTNAYSAEFGRGNGAIVNAVIKSGKNQLHGSLWEFLRNEKLDSKNYFDDRKGSTPPYKRNQFGGTFGGPVYIPGVYDGHDHTFFFFDYEALRVRQAQTQNVFVPPSATWRNGNFADLLTSTPALTDQSNPNSAPALDCSGNPTFLGEIFDTRQTQQRTGVNYPLGLCGVPFAGNIIPTGQIDPLAMRLTALFPSDGPVDATTGNNFLANPVLKESRKNFDARVDQRFSDADNVFFRFSFENQPSSIPGTFPGLGDGGGFFSGVEDNSYRSFATSWTHIFKPQLINEFRLGYNRINSQRAQFNANLNVSADPSINFPGVPFSPGIGGLPQLGFSDVATLGSPTYLPSKELQNSYTLSENLTWVRGHNTFKFGTEIRREEFTIFQPASPRGNLSFSPQFTDNPAALGSGGSGFASFLVGLTDGGGINNLHNVDYFRQTYSFYGQDDWKITPKLTLNLGLRYEVFLPVTERHDQLGTFDLTNTATPTLIVPKGQAQQLTPIIASIVTISRTGSKSLIRNDLNNIAPRVGLAYQVTDKTVVRAGYGIFYGGQENGPYSNPSPGFNPPFFVAQSFSGGCGFASANPTLFNSDPLLNQDCAVDGLSNQPGNLPGQDGLFVGFPATALTDPNTPTFFSVDQHLRTPYMQQWHLGFQQELPGDSVLELTYAGSKGTKLYTFFNGNQATPVDPAIDSRPNALRRPFPTIDAGIDWFRSTGKSDYNSLQAHYEKRFSHGLQIGASYTWAHSIDISSNANLGPTQNNSDFRDVRFPGAEYGNSDFDIRQRFVLSSIYELPIGHGKKFLGDASGVFNQIVGGWQMSNIVSISTGNWYTVLDGTGNYANADGNAGGVSQRPDRISDPLKAGPVLANSDPACHTTISQGGLAADRVGVPASFFNTCAFDKPVAGTFGNVGRNTIQGPGNRDWDFSLFKTFSAGEKAHLEFRAEFFNILNHTNFLFAKSGPQNGNGSTIRGASQFGSLTAARDPRQIQLALKLSF